MAYLRGGFILDIWWQAKGIFWKGRNTQGGRGPARARRVRRKGRQSVTMEEKSRRKQGQSVCVIPSLFFGVVSFASFRVVSQREPCQNDHPATPCMAAA